MITRHTRALPGLAALVALSLAGCASEDHATSAPAGALAPDATSADTSGGGDGPSPSPDAGFATSDTSSGWQGADGSDGTDGTDGTDSTDGFDGWDATDGTDGTSGGQPNVGPNGECLPSCNGKQCGPDGCGGTCGWCGGGDSCQGGACVSVAGCTPDCAAQMIGVDDGCGGVCSGSGFGIGLVPGGAQDAAYFRSQVLAGEVPSPDVLPIEGWLTEHGTSLPAPLHDRLVTLHGFVGLFYDPEVGEPTVALQLGMNSGLAPEAIEEGRFNLSVVIDRSGSMASEQKMDFVKDGLVKMLDSLDEHDILSIVIYSTTANVVLEPTPVTDKAAIAAIIEGIQTGGQTNLWAGLKLGYEQVMKNVAKKELTPRVILLSDGLVNQGVQDTSSILAGSASYNQDVGLTTIGVGAEFNFELMHLLATQGQGNFYFLDTAEKLAEVFEQEITYWLTPVADNLKVWFSLPDGFAVEDIYGFEYKNENGTVHLLGPSPQTTIGPGGEQPEDPPDTGEEPDVAVSTLFASKKNGLLMVKLQSPGADVLTSFENMPLTTVYYSYDLVETGETEGYDTEIQIGALDYNGDSGYEYFSGAIMQRNFCILRAGLAMRTALALVEEDPVGNIQPAVAQLGYARTFCTGINVQLNDARIVEDVALMLTLMDNICGDACADPASE